MDKILIRGLRFCLRSQQREKESGQPFELDITITADLSKACETDCISDTISYSKVAKLAVEVMLLQK